MFQAHRVSVVTFHGPAEKRIFAPYNSGFSRKMRTKTPRGIQAMNSNYMLPLRRKTCWCGAASPPVSTDDRPPYGRSPRLSSAGPPRCRPVSHKDIWYGNGSRREALSGLEYLPQYCSFPSSSPASDWLSECSPAGLLYRGAADFYKSRRLHIPLPAAPGT